MRLLTESYPLHSTCCCEHSGYQAGQAMAAAQPSAEPTPQNQVLAPRRPRSAYNLWFPKGDAQRSAAPQTGHLPVSSAGAGRCRQRRLRQLPLTHPVLRASAPCLQQHLAFLQGWKAYIAPKITQLLTLLAGQEVARNLAVAQVSAGPACRLWLQACRRWLAAGQAAGHAKRGQAHGARQLW